MQESTWWPALTTTVDRALQRGWSLDDLAATAPVSGTDVDDAAAMTWTITTLMDDPTHLQEARATRHDHETAASPFDPHPNSVQATDEEYRDHLNALTRPSTLDRVPKTTVRDQTPEHRWAVVAARIDARLPEQQDWRALAHTMQRLHDEGHDVERFAQLCVDEEPLAPNRPAQDLRYRLAAAAPQSRDAFPVSSPRMPRRPESERHGLATGMPRAVGPSR
jgi:hypothetical protein